uniref:Uncharacterized protein LOC116941017 isoform X3 n=1 Tax=Petromyzon marinus TaxID=7757 RepID=A0AAJ7WRG2_PETMA|nr:uncharacterized protein LOC116941017 isoform X3 [Petromyzon marinus]
MEIGARGSSNRLLEAAGDGEDKQLPSEGQQASTVDRQRSAWVMSCQPTHLRCPQVNAPRQEAQMMWFWQFCPTSYGTRVPTARRRASSSLALGKAQHCKR